MELIVRSQLTGRLKNVALELLDDLAGHGVLQAWLDTIEAVPHTFCLVAEVLLLCVQLVLVHASRRFSSMTCSAKSTLSQAAARTSSRSCAAESSPWASDGPFAVDSLCWRFDMIPEPPGHTLEANKVRRGASFGLYKYCTCRNL